MRARDARAVSLLDVALRRGDDRGTTGSDAFRRAHGSRAHGAFASNGDDDDGDKR